MRIEIDTTGFSFPSAATLERAIASAINKTVVTAKKEMSAGVREVYNIKKRDLDPHITVRKAKASDTQSIITVKSKSIGLIHFNATATKAFDRGSKRYFKTSARVLKRNRKRVIKGAFIGKGKGSRSWQVFRRTSSKRLPIRKLSVITPTTMTKKEGVDDFTRVIRKDFNKNFKHEFKYFMGKQK